jgi:hypothetical protein
MNIKELRKQIKNDELIKLTDGSKVFVTKTGKDYMVSFEKLNHDMFTFNTLKETIEYIVAIDNI